MDKFVLNGKSYKVAPLDFDFMCDLEDDGISIENLGDKPLNLIRKFVSFATGLPKGDAGKEISKHLENGGDFQSIMDAFTSALKESGFFRQTPEGAKENTRKGAGKTQQMEIVTED